MRTINPSIHDDPEIAPRWLGDRDEVSFLDLLIVLSKSKRLIFWTTVIVAVLTVIISFYSPRNLHGDRGNHASAECVRWIRITVTVE